MGRVPLRDTDSTEIIKRKIVNLYPAFARTTYAISYISAYVINLDMFLLPVNICLG